MIACMKTTIIRSPSITVHMQYMHTYNFIQNIDSCSLYPEEKYEVNVYVTVQYINHISIINFENFKSVYKC